MAWQGVKAILLFVCCIGSVLAHKPISTLDRFFGVDYDSSDGEAVKSEVLAQDRGHEMKSELAVFCNNNTMKVILPSGSLSQVKILGFAVSESVLGAPAACGYSLTQGHGHNVLVVDYTGCHVTLEDGRYTLRVLYPNEAGKLDAATLSCHANQSLTASLKPLDVQSDQPLDRPLDVQSDQPLDVQSDQPLDRPLDVQSDRPLDRPLDVQSDRPLDVQSDQPCPKLPLTQPSQSSPPLYPPSLLLLNSKPGGCTISADQRVSCSTSGVAQDECLTRGCCFDADTSVCYYPMDECTADMNFVFAIHNDFTNVPVDPMSFIVAGKTGCKPVFANKDFAIFKFSVTECGTRSFVIGETTIYLAEVQTVIKVRNLKYGMISRDNPIRLMVECRYQKVSTDPRLSRPVLASAGYMVMSPSLPPYLLSEGLFGVQLMISEDETFTNFYPHCHLPLHVLLGKSVYLELRLSSPQPAATLLVHYGVAYPRSAKSALILLYEGCPNPLDSGSTSILYVKHLPQNRYQRRFEIKAFQFMDLSTNKYINEEIYFMCSTEVCMPSVSPCEETCFDGKSP